MTPYIIADFWDNNVNRKLFKKQTKTNTLKSRVLLIINIKNTHWKHTATEQKQNVTKYFAMNV